MQPLLEELPIGVELLLGLVEVASVGREGGLVVGDDCVAGGAREAAYECWIVSVGARRSGGGGVADRGGHHRAQCIRSGGCLRKGPLAAGLDNGWAWRGRGLCTVDIHLVLLHELAQLGEAVGGVDLFHVEQAEYGRLVEGSGGVDGQTLRCTGCLSRVGAPEEAREQHRCTGVALSPAGPTRAACRMRLSAPRLQPGARPQSHLPRPPSVLPAPAVAPAKLSHQPDRRPKSCAALR